MADRPKALTALIDDLAGVFDTEDDSRMVVDRAGIPAGNIKFSSAALLNWTEIVNEAVKQDAVQRIVEVAERLYPNLRLRDHLHGFEQWKVKHHGDEAAIEKAATQPAPGIWERMQKAIVSWVSIVIACFALIGVMARESLHLFFQLPATNPVADVFTAPEEWAVDGLVFFARTAYLAVVTYAAENPIGVVVTILVAVGLTWLVLQQRPPLIDRFYVPAIVVPLIIVAAVVKALWYDIPTFSFEDVLKTRSVDMTSFDIPPFFAGRALEQWRGVVCSRIANSGLPDAEQLCGSLNAEEHKQNLIGSYLLNVVLTIVICIFGVAMIRRLIKPSKNPRWNVPPVWRRLAVSLLSLSLLLALLLVPWSYSRTVRSMEFPWVCDDAACRFYICTDESECYTYTPPSTIAKASGGIPAGAESRGRDILDASFQAQMDSIDVDPLDHAVRFSGGSP